MRGVSVIIPYFNRPLKLQRAVESVVNQELDVDLEIIVVDDASSIKPNLVELSRVFKDIKVFALDTNSGACIARNHGADNSKYDILAFLDSDDEWQTNHLSECIALLEDTSPFVYSSYRVVSDKGVRTRQLRTMSNSNVIEYLFEAGGDIRTSTFIMKKDFFEKVRFNDQAKKHQDWDFAARAAVLTRPVLSPHPTVDIYVGASNRMSASTNLEASLDFIRRFRDKTSKNIVRRFRKSL